MSMLKNLWNKLFVDDGMDEDEEIISGELEDLVMEDPDKTLKEKRKLEKQQKKLEKLERKMKQYEEEQFAQEKKVEVDTEVKEEKVMIEEVKQPTEEVVEPVEVKDSFVNIEIEKNDLFIKKAQRRPRSSMARFDESKEYVYAPVISPYYGQSEKETKQVKEVKKASTATLNAKKNKDIDPFSTIVSPFYGKNVVVEAKEEVQEDKKKLNSTKIAPVIVESEPEVNFVQNDLLEEQSLTLEQIIGKEEKGDIEQISLFGDGELLEQLSNPKGDD